jgi:DDE superfamily endonuclease/Helix-turn-helix of DDE superfamily endonuclease
MTGMRPDQLAMLILAVSTLVGDAWQPKTGRPKSLALPRAIVLTLFLLRHDNVQDVAGELFGCSQATVSRTTRRLRPLLRQATAEIAAQVEKRARLGAVLLDGFIAPTGERSDRTDLFSGKHRVCGMNVQVVADLDGRVIDTGTPIGGSRHDSVAFVESGIAGRWATHLSEDGPGMLADKGYQGCGPYTPYRKPRGRQLTEVRKACNHALNSLRAAVERAISHLVNWKILDIGYRGRLTEFPDLLRTVTNLEIYRAWS